MLSTATDKFKTLTSLLTLDEIYEQMKQYSYIYNYQMNQITLNSVTMTRRMKIEMVMKNQYFIHFLISN